MFERPTRAGRERVRRRPNGRCDRPDRRNSTVTPGDTVNGLSWTAATDGGSGLHPTTTYDIRFLTGGTPPTCLTGTSLGTQATTAFNHTSLTNGTQYSYRVCAYDALDNASAGATGSGTPATVPTLTEPAASMFTDTTANVSGNISSDGGASLTARGTCWNTTTPVVNVGGVGNNCAAEGGTGTGTFIQDVTGLPQATEDLL